jgi:fructokinase
VQVHIENGSHRFEILPMQAYDFIHPAVVRMASLSVNPALVYFGTLAQRHEVSKRALKTLLRSTDAARFLDINLRAPWYDEKTLRLSLQNADIVKLNIEEVDILAEMLVLSGSNSQDQVRELLDQFDLAQVLVTCGDAGAWQINRDGKIAETGKKKRAITLVDTVGAGDGFASVFILGTLLGWPMPTTLDRANAFAAAICEIRGAIPDHADFYQPFTEEWSK